MRADRDPDRPAHRDAVARPADGRSRSDRGDQQQRERRQVLQDEQQEQARRIIHNP